MNFEAISTLAVIALTAGVLVFTKLPADLALWAAVAALMLLPVPRDGGWIIGVIDAREALSGLSNQAAVTVGVLFIVVAGLRETGGMEAPLRIIFGRPKTTAAALLRIMLPTASMSAFLNNTPIVAMLIPPVNDWAKRLGISPSKLLMPLSYAAILGGTCTLIGTSTNLVVAGLVISQTDLPPLKIFEVAKVGVPCAAVGVCYVLAAARWLLPDRKPASCKLADPREYVCEVLVESKGPLVGKTIREAGLRHLPGLFLVEIDRGGSALQAVDPEERLRGDDRLVFAGIVESIKDLWKIRGLAAASDQTFKLNAPRTHRCLIEAVVSNSCPAAHKTIREAKFRTRYNAAVLAVARNNERVQGKIGSIKLRPGDTLLLEAHPGFVGQHRNSRDFFLVGKVDDSAPARHEKSWIALSILAAMTLSAATGLLTMLEAAMLAAGLMIAMRCCSSASARQSIDWQVLMAITAALALGEALHKTGAAKFAAERLIGLAGESPRVSLAAVYAMTVCLTEVITNNAAAALMFPLATAAANKCGVSAMPFIMATMTAASSSFASPLGYQTNLMVYGPGGYRFSDYLKLGLPLDLLLGAVYMLTIPIAWPF